MTIREELKEVSALRRKWTLLQKSMDSASRRGAQAEYKRYKQEYDAIDRVLKKHDQRKKTS